MALKLAGRNPAKFIFDDGVSETTVTITPDDEPGAVRAKLQRVLELENGPAAPKALVFPPGVRAPLPADPAFTPTDREAMDARLEGVKVMGWNEDAAAGGGLEELPEIG